jgi:hypothetical protein
MNRLQWLLHRIRVEMHLLAKLFLIGLRSFYFKFFVHFVDFFVYFVETTIRFLFYTIPDLLVLLGELLVEFVALLLVTFLRVLTRFYEFLYKDRRSEGFKDRSFQGFDDLFVSLFLNELVYVFISFYLLIYSIHFMHWMEPIRMAFFSFSQFVNQPFIQFFAFCFGLFFFLQQQDVFQDPVTRYFWESQWFQRYDKATHFTKAVSFLTIFVLCCAVVIKYRDIIVILSERL